MMKTHFLSIGWLEDGRYSDKNLYGNSVMRLLIIIKHVSFKESEDSEFRGTNFQINPETWFM